MLWGLLDFTAGDLGASLVYDVMKYAFAVLLWTRLRWLYTRLRSLNREWAFRYNERQLEQFLLFRNDRTALTQYLVSQGLWALLLVGVGMMFLPLGQTPGGRDVLLVVGWMLGGAIYVITLTGPGTLHHLTRSPERAIERMSRRLATLREE